MISKEGIYLPLYIFLIFYKRCKYLYKYFNLAKDFIRGLLNVNPSKRLNYE